VALAYVGGAVDPVAAHPDRPRDALGLTSLHVNRILQEFRRNGLTSSTIACWSCSKSSGCRRSLASPMPIFISCGAPDVVTRYLDRLPLRHRLTVPASPQREA
jgi:hypothetical protein